MHSDIQTHDDAAKSLHTNFCRNSLGGKVSELISSQGNGAPPSEPDARVTPELSPTWLSALSPRCRDLFFDAVSFSEGSASKTGQWDEILSAIHSPPSCQVTKEALAQFFTPSDVALYASFGLLSNYKGEKVFDPCVGHGSLLIAVALVLAEQEKLSGLTLVEKIHGCELDATTRLVAIESIASVLHRYAPEMSLVEIKTRLYIQIQLGDFNDYATESISKFRVIANPPYKEGPTGNVWIPIAERLIRADITGITLIVPVAIATSRRTQALRDLMFAKFSTVKALHHEIRPRPLFKGVDQRISIVTGLSLETFEKKYVTTGFLRHKARERQSVWTAPEVCLTQSLCRGLLPKVSPMDLHYFREFGPGSYRVRISDLQDSTTQDIWVRTTGRYHLLAQTDKPVGLTSKWKKIAVPNQIAEQFLAAFSNGDLLRWWQIFGDGRDISITALRSEFGVRL